jgi:Oxidoreductase molybdopterin binding domain
VTKDPGCESLDGYSPSIDMASALQPQTILALDLEEKPLAPQWGAPLRRRVPTKLGFKSARNLEAIEASHKYPGATRRTKAMTRSLAFDGAAGDAIKSLIPDPSQLKRKACTARPDAPHLSKSVCRVADIRSSEVQASRTVASSIAGSIRNITEQEQMCPEVTVHVVHVAKHKMDRQHPGCRGPVLDNACLE